MRVLDNRPFPIVIVLLAYIADIHTFCIRYSVGTYEEDPCYFVRTPFFVLGEVGIPTHNIAISSSSMLNYSRPS
jgi:hypothetical protein